jgi:hypothetical protein
MPATHRVVERIEPGVFTAAGDGPRVAISTFLKISGDVRKESALIMTDGHRPSIDQSDYDLWISGAVARRNSG